MSSEKNFIKMQIALPPDAAGFVGFECPSCRGYFKVLDATFTASAHVVNTFRNSKNVRVTREQHSSPAAPIRPTGRTLPQQNTCPKCALVYAFESNARVCPQYRAPVA